MKLDCNIYGEDLTSTASECAAKALSAPKLVDPFASASDSKGGGGDKVVSTAPLEKSHSSNASDSRAVSKGGGVTAGVVSKGKRE